MIKEIRKINIFEYEIYPFYPLKTRECNILKNMGMNTIGDVLYYCADDKDKLKYVNGIGPNGVAGIKNLIKTVIKDKRIYLGMPIEDIEKFKANGNGYAIEEKIIKTSVFDYKFSEIINKRSILWGLGHGDIKSMYDLFVLCSKGTDRLLSLYNIGKVNKDIIEKAINDILSETEEPVYLGMSKKDIDKYINNKQKRIVTISGEEKIQKEEKSQVEEISKDEKLPAVEENFQSYDELCNRIKKLEEEVKNKEEEIKNKEIELKKLEDKIKEYEILKNKKKDLEELSSRLDNRILKLLYEFNHVQETSTELQKIK